MKTRRILHREYFIDLERNAYSWRIVSISHRLENSLLAAPASFIRPKRPQSDTLGRLSKAT